MIYESSSLFFFTSFFSHEIKKKKFEGLFALAWVLLASWFAFSFCDFLPTKNDGWYDI